jgi:hypothetical protein
MRAILVDWLVDVHLRFSLRDETLFLAQFLIDAYIVHNQVQRNQLQLLGITAMLIATKYEEIYPPQVPIYLLFSYKRSKISYTSLTTPTTPKMYSKWRGKFSFPSNSISAKSLPSFSLKNSLKNSD